MKKATKTAIKKETKTKKAPAAMTKAVQKKKTSGEVKEKKAAKAKEVLPEAAKTETKKVIKPKTKTVTKEKPLVKTITEKKPSPIIKPAAKKKTAPKALPKKMTAAVKSKPKAITAAKPLKAAVPGKATPKPVLKSSEKKSVSPARKPAGVTQKKAVPAIKKVKSETTKDKLVVAKKKTAAALLQPSLKKTVVPVAARTAAPVRKAKELLTKQPVKGITKVKKISAEPVKSPLKKQTPGKAISAANKPAPAAKPLKDSMPVLKPAANPKAVKPKEKPVKKSEKGPAKSLPVTAKKPAVRKETVPAAPAAAVKTTSTEKATEPARKIQSKAISTPVAPVKKSRIVRPAVPAVTEQADEELLSVAEIEAREGRVIKPRLKIFLPRDESREEIQATGETEDNLREGRASLPLKYGESEFFLLVIDPILIFIDWEIRLEDLPAEGLPLCVRIYDITGITFDGTNAHGFIDIGLEGLIGSGYCEIKMQGREIIAEIGFMDAHGVFVSLMRSAKASVPPLLQYDELGIIQKMQEAGLPVGY
ncbi:MAG: hypothetical protein C0402_03980 [Thermodesulfovibrio sp.]|nr:hypothetical protein [Thermodesulfovibrio sp.]